MTGRPAVRRMRRARAPGACYSPRVGRLDNIVARNRRPNRLHERLIVSMVLGLVVLVIIALAVFTDLGLPPDAGDARGGQGAPGAPAADRGKRVDGVLLRVPPAKPAQH